MTYKILASDEWAGGRNRTRPEGRNRTRNVRVPLKYRGSKPNANHAKTWQAWHFRRGSKPNEGGSKPNARLIFRGRRSALTMSSCIFLRFSCPRGAFFVGRRSILGHRHVKANELWVWRKRAFAWPAQCLLTCGPSFKAVKASKYKDVDVGTIDERQQRICCPFRRICAGRWACEQIDVNTPQKKGAALKVLSMDVHQPVGII